MCCKYLDNKIIEDIIHHKCSINNSVDNVAEFLEMKSRYEDLFPGKCFMPNGDCIFKYNDVDLTKCPCYEAI